MKCDEWMGMLDAFVDGELGGDAREGILQHARACEKCALELKRAEKLKQMLAGLDDGVRVPLAAQAAWRNAVKAEARKKRARGIYRVAGAVAAACVVLVGVAAGLNLFGSSTTHDPVGNLAGQSSDAASFAFVEPDGNENAQTLKMMPSASEPVERTSTVRISADDIAAAVDTVNSLVDEFNGSVDDRSVSASTAYMTASIPAGEYDAFIDSLSYAGKVDVMQESDADDDMVSVSITIQ